MSLKTGCVTCTMTVETTGGGWILTRDAVLPATSRRASVVGRTRRLRTISIGLGILVALCRGEPDPKRTIPSLGARAAARSSTSVGNVSTLCGVTLTLRREHLLSLTRAALRTDYSSAGLTRVI